MKASYPNNWKAISWVHRHIFAENKCEFCGCENRKPNPKTGSLVVLTVAHMNHIPQDCRRKNLKALCQACHLKYDAKHHAETRRIKAAEAEAHGIKKNGLDL